MSKGRASPFLRNLMQLTEEQGWHCRPKEDGYLFFPPLDKVRPGFQSVYADDPHNDTHHQKIIRDRMSKAGLKFQKEESPSVQNPSPKTNGVARPAETAPSDPFELLRLKVNEAMARLADIETLIGQIEKDTAEMQKFKEMLKSIIPK